VVRVIGILSLVRVVGIPGTEPVRANLVAFLQK